MQNKYYVYSHLNSKGEVFYIGKGKDKRAWNKAGRSEAWKVCAKNGFSVDILACQLSESDSFLIERKHIARLKNQLCNVTSGGQGISGMIHSDATKEKISRSNSKAHIGVKLSAEHVEARASAQRGKPKSETMKAKLRATLSTQENKDALSKRAKMYAADPVMRAKKAKSLSDALRGRVFSPEHRLKISQGQGGKPVVCVENNMSFGCSKDAERWLKTQGTPKAFSGNIINMIKGKHKSAYGYTWKYADETSA